MAEPRVNLLIVEDEPQIRRLLRTALVAEGYKVVEASTARRGTIDASTHKPDIAIVDLGLPDGDGVEVVRTIREWSTMPIIVLSARSTERAKIEALDAGADDYVTKPFCIGELLARIRVALRHVAHTGHASAEIALGDVRIDLAARRATRAGTPIHLTPIEFRFLARLGQHLGMVVTQRQLLTEVWGPSHVNHSHYLRIYAKQLRYKLEADPLRPRYLITETGVGYRLVADD